MREIETQSENYFGEDEQEKYKRYISYVVRALMGINILVCVSGMLGLTTKSVTLHSFTILLSTVSRLLSPPWVSPNLRVPIATPHHTHHAWWPVDGHPDRDPPQPPAT